MRFGLWASEHVPNHYDEDAQSISEDSPMRKTQSRASMAVAALVISVLVFGLGLKVGYEAFRSDANCLNDYANDLSESLAPRQTATESRDARIKDVLEASVGFLDQDDPQELQFAIRRYLEADALLRFERQQNPYPDPPEEACP